MERNTGGLQHRLSPTLPEKVQASPGCFKRKLLSTNQTGFMKLIYIMLSIIYIDLYNVFDFLDAQPSKFPFTPSFIEYVVLLIPFFLFFSGQVLVLCFVSWQLIFSSSCFILRGSLYSIHYTVLSYLRYIFVFYSLFSDLFMIIDLYNYFDALT